MRYFKWTAIATVALLVFGFLHYTLPQHDIARVVDTDVRRIDFGENSIFWASPDVGTEAALNRDVRFINTVRANGSTMVFRNEDTGWGWPPYFKLDSSNLQTEARDLASTSAAPQWVVVTHYGWRNEFMTIYPNAVGVRAVDSPDVRIIPWFNIFFLIIVGLIALRIFRIIQKFRRRHVDPVLEDMGEAWDSAGDHADAAQDRAKGMWGGFLRWLKTWRSNK